MTMMTMTANETSSSFNTTHTGGSVAWCSLLGEYSWREEYLTPTTFIILAATACVKGLMIPFTALANALVIWVVSSHRQLRRKKPCVLLACLAATDLLVGVVALPLAITDHAMRLGANPSICVMERIAYDVFFVSCGASLCHLVIISGERYVAIKHALRYETLVTSERLLVAIGVAWALPVVAASVPFLNVDNTAFRDQFMDAMVFFCTSSFMVLIGYCQVAMYLEGRRHQRHIRAHQVSGANAREIIKKDKAARTMAMVAGALLLCYIPQAAVFAVFAALENPPTSVFVTSLLASEAFVYLNSMISPILYCMRTRDLRKAVGEIVLRLRRTQPEINIRLGRRGVPSRSQTDGDVTRDASQRERRRVSWAGPQFRWSCRVHSLDLTNDSQRDAVRARCASLPNSVLLA